MNIQGRKFLINAFAMAAALVSAPTFAHERFYAGSPQNCTIELNGDSILHGYGLPTTPAAWLSAYGYPVVDLAVDGQSTYQLGQSNFFTRSHASRIVVIQTGINDHRREYEGWWYVPTVEGVKQDYRRMIEHVRRLEKIPVVAGVSQLQYPNALGPEAYNTVAQIRAAVREVAAETNTHYASFDINPVAWTDTIHLDQASSNGLAENLRYVAAYICMLPF